MNTSDKSDRELLELAARAAGLTLTTWSEFYKGFLVNPSAEAYDLVIDITGPWNPLTDDGDALRLAVKLDIGTRRYGNIIEVVAPRDGSYGRILDEFCGDDRATATRRAIVRAAAGIGAAQ